MFKVDEKRAKIVEEHFYPWRKLLAVVILFTVLSFIPLVPGWLQGIFQVAGVAGMFLAGGRWMFDRTISFDLDPISEEEYDQGRRN